LDELLPKDVGPPPLLLLLLLEAAEVVLSDVPVRPCTPVAVGHAIPPPELPESCTVHGAPASCVDDPPAPAELPTPPETDIAVRRQPPDAETATSSPHISSPAVKTFFLYLKRGE